MPNASKRAIAKSKGYCVNCESPHPDRVPTHGNRCDVCWAKHMLEKYDAKRAKQGRSGGQGGRLKGFSHGV